MTVVAMSDQRKPQIARLKWLFASVEWSIARYRSPRCLPLRRQLG